MGSTLNLIYVSGIRVLPKFLVSEVRGRGRIRILASGNGSGGSTVLSSDSSNLVGSNGVAVVREKKMNRVNGENGKLGSEIEKNEIEYSEESEELEVLWEDGFGNNSVKDYFDRAKELTKPDGGPPRWFCPVECGSPLKNSPVLLFLPGLGGIGVGLILHQKALGRVFEVRCLHIPVYDRTPFEGLVKFVENTVRLEHALFPSRPIYLVGDSFGGCLALAVAARNPAIDLVLVLVNPATSFGKSYLQLLLPILDALPDELHVTVRYLLSLIMGDPVKMASITVQSGLPPAQAFQQISTNLTSLLRLLSGFTDIIPKETLRWKLKLLKSAASYANSRLHAVKAEVLVLASGKDYMLPSGDEAKRLWSTLQNCRVRYFKNNGHSLLLEDGMNLLTILKGATKYRRSRKHDFISDYVPPSKSEFGKLLDDGTGLRMVTSPVFLSTLEDGRIVRGLAGVPNEGPVLIVGYHMLMGLELTALIEQFLIEKRVMVRGMAHPALYVLDNESPLQEFSYLDRMRQFGSVPVTPSNLYRLLSSNEFVLLYPGGAREALHRKSLALMNLIREFMKTINVAEIAGVLPSLGEEYKLFWPDQPEFVRMAARFEATIIPFGVVGEDDIAEMVLDYDDQMKIPILNDWIKEQNANTIKVRTDEDGEVANQAFFLPGLLPKVPGRFYYLFGKPIQTKGQKEMLKDKEKANALYTKVQSEIENIISYLKDKREKDPYRGVLERTIYKAISEPTDNVPTFDP